LPTCEQSGSVHWLPTCEQLAAVVDKVCDSRRRQPDVVKFLGVFDQSIYEDRAEEHQKNAAWLGSVRQAAGN
jgi:hypothetical protein